MIETRDRTVPRARRLGAALLALVAAAALTACAEGAGRSGGGGANFVEGTGVVTAIAPEDRVAAPELTGESTHGEPLALADYAGKVVVLNVWGSWCAPCRAEAPGLAAVAAETADQGVQFVGINTRDLERVRAQRFDDTFGITYPSFYDPKGKLILEFPDGTLSAQAGIPSTLILDRQGRIAVRALKPLTEEELRAALDPVIAESAPGA
ncbi:TlpA family protein disulfide reductase [Streptomyces aidingensis]|uniref:Thiol-disulfide isomerase or thioredoxin n=1 Tax=Streptomyces aidingensis TaxID=910347 RepID=A0A1I1I444_9ACTN|nr:TlpA disulfide reductase family protein [Streptomyces aidingensis]SFC27980.1 Thiol-disulfide isomerase or thioredoxin [Streptomyces aidingensis]